jgi:coniferyl-aldehyde dehydrogenase
MTTHVAPQPTAGFGGPALGELLRLQRARFAGAPPDYDQRILALHTLRDALRTREAALADAISADFGGRSRHETRLLELLPLTDLIRHACSSLAGWMKPRRAASSWFLLPSRAYTIHQPLGVVGIMGAWNYPLLLTIGPLVDALAAGNHAMLKPSELAPETAAVLAQLFSDAFPTEYVAAITGDVDVSAVFAALPFDHLVFTGSSRVGELVMRAASRNLTPVTLELGGKSPAIVHSTYPLEKALRRILVGKLLNAGQTCIAPDYVLVPRGSEFDVERMAPDIVRALYPRLVDNTDYTRILSATHYAQLTDLVDGARAFGAHVLTINPASEACSIGNKVFPPTLVFNPPGNSRLMRDEIFGPILPVMTYASLDEAIAFVNARPRPLALYYFDDDRDRVDLVVSATTSGGVTVNDVLLHIAQHDLPFGGVGPSGMGHYHGRDGFERFSKKKGVMIQARRPFSAWLAPPFTARKDALIRRLLSLARG